MKKSLINTYLDALNTLVNDNRISFSITCNFTDKCHIVAYWCNSQVLHNFVLFNDSSIVNYDNLVSHYLAIMAKHPTRSKQLFKLNYDTKGYCYLAVTNESNLEFIGVRSKRINKKLAEYLYNNLDSYNVEMISQYTNRYMQTYDFNICYIFKL